MGRAKIAGLFLPEVESGCSQSGGEAELRGEGTRLSRDWGPFCGPLAPALLMVFLVCARVVNFAEGPGAEALRPTWDLGRGLLRWGRGDQLSRALLRSRLHWISQSWLSASAET